MVSRIKHVNHKRTIITAIPTPIYNNFSVRFITMNYKTMASSPVTTTIYNRMIIV